MTAAPRSYRIAAIPGDGIGQEVVPAGVRVLDAAAGRYGFDLRWQWFRWGADYYRQHSVMMPADGLAALADCDAI